MIQRQRFRLNISGGFALFLCVMSMISPPSLHAQNGIQNVRLTPAWSSASLFEVPESALYDQKRQRIYVSNIGGNPREKDQNGFISILRLDGEIESLKWVSGLDAPKGMAIVGNSLYAADISKVVEIDIDSGKILRSYDLNGKFLNDMANDETGTLYISDSDTDAIYEIRDGQAQTWLQDKRLARPNGLLVEGPYLLVNSVRGGSVMRVDRKTKEIALHVQLSGMPDGIVPLFKGNYIVSSWDGEIFFANGLGESRSLLSTRAEKINAADIEFIPSQSLLLVPTFFDNRVNAYNVTY